MGQVFTQAFGSGIIFVDDYYPVNGQTITITCVPYLSARLDHITATDSWDNPIAIDPQALSQQLTFNSAWNNLYLEAHFTIEPEPPQPTFPYWLLFKIREGNNNVK